MNLIEQARLVHDQIQINRVIQAVVFVAIEHGRRQARRVIADPTPVATRAILVLAAMGGEWATDDEALLSDLRSWWRLIA